MLKEFLHTLLHSKPAASSGQAKGASHQPSRQEEPRYPLGNGFYWEFDQIRNGLGGYKTVDVYLLKMDDPDFKRCIVNRAGQIQNFPGFQNDKWKRAFDFSFADNEVHFTFSISPYQEGKARVRWLIQPDGRYFEDEDGFGAEHCVEIEMYSFLDENGQFTEPFFLE